MEVFIVLCILIFLACVFGPIISSANKKSKLKQKQFEHTQKHNSNLNYLYQIGFRIEEQYHPNGSAIYIYYDYTNKNVGLEYFLPGTCCTDITIFPLGRIVECELIQNGSVISREEGNLAGATILGYGAMAGKKQSFSEEMGGVLAIRLVIDDMRIPSVTINVLQAAISKASQDYQRCFFIAQEIYGKFQGIVRINNLERQRQEQQHTTAPQIQSAEQLKTSPQPKLISSENILDQIRALASLKDEGILTSEEFDSKKKMLMEKIQ